MEMLVEATLKASAILLIGLAAAAILRKRSASLRHAVLGAMRVSRPVTMLS